MKKRILSILMVSIMLLSVSIISYAEMRSDNNTVFCDEYFEHYDGDISHDGDTENCTVKVTLEGYPAPCLKIEYTIIDMLTNRVLVEKTVTAADAEICVDQVNIHNNGNPIKVSAIYSVEDADGNLLAQSDCSAVID